MHRLRAALDVVLRIFHRRFHGLSATRQDRLHHFRRHTEGRRAFIGIQHPQTAAGAGPHIKQPPAIAQTSTISGSPWRYSLFAEQGRRNRRILLQHQADRRRHRHPVESLRARVALLGRR